MVLDAVLTEAPRAEVPALILADAALAQALGWDYVVPLLAAGLKRADLRKRGYDLRLACHRAVTASAVEATRLAVDLARRAALLKRVAPKLRAQGAGEAVEIFLTQDAVAPTVLALHSPESIRARHRSSFANMPAIQTCLTMKVLFGMALRQTTGFVESLLRLSGLDWLVPNFSTLSRRQKTLQVNIPYRGSDGPLHLLIPSRTLLRNTLTGSGQHRHQSRG